jgi:enamine deaminase RidA (YjgF/YER057c/UK114 family)
MTQTIAAAVAALGFQLPVASRPAANYVSTAIVGNLLFVSGQINDYASERVAHLGGTASAEEGRAAAHTATLSLLAQIAAATDGSVAAVKRVVRLGVFIAATPAFTAHSAVANGASDLLVAALGEAGRHVRTSVGVASLPAGALVEVDAIVELAHTA